jgi:predicted ATPase
VPVKGLSISGFRGFVREQAIEFAQPTGQAGSGVSVLVGPNGGGKSTVLEALRAAASPHDVSFTVSQRNQDADDRISIAWETDEGSGSLCSVRAGSSETRRDGAVRRIVDLLHIPSRRAFSPYFGSSTHDRTSYMTFFGLPETRATSVDGFSGRLFNIERQGPRDDFNALLSEIAGADLDWSIDRHDSGQFYVRVRKGGSSHTSDGLGEGTVSLLVLTDALYDSHPGETIVIDEPELSLHPIHQRRLRNVLSRYAADRQIVLATHSPYLIDWDDLMRGGSIHRVHRGTKGESTISTAHRSTLEALGGLVDDVQNPHVLGLAANEIFFLEDGVFVTEGQEDVVVYQLLAKQIDKPFDGTFFGWGSGGAEKMPFVIQLLRDLGFTAVVGILDGNRADLAKTLDSSFAPFEFVSIPTADVRSKDARKATAEIFGLADHGGRLIPEHSDAVHDLIDGVNATIARLRGQLKP